MKLAHLYGQMILSQIKALIWSTLLTLTETQTQAHLFQASPSVCMRVGVCIVSMLHISRWNLATCLHGGEKWSFDVLQEAAMHSENVLSVVTVYKPAWRITQGRKVSGINYGYHMSGAGTDSWARVLFEDWNMLINMQNVAMRKRSKFCVVYEI